MLMALDRLEWARRVDMSNFVNAYYQLRDVGRCGAVQKILIAGPGQGLDRLVLKWRSYRVTTLDVDPIFRPDILGSVHRMGMFRDGEFDVVIASHVLEHLPPSLLDDALREVARVGRYALIYVPVHGIHLQLRVRSSYRNMDRSCIVDLHSPLASPSDRIAAFMDGNHFWEIGVPGYGLKSFANRLRVSFEILDSYRNPDWLPSYNFVLRSIT